MNKFEEEIAALNKERDEKMAEIQEKIDRLMAQNANMNQLRRLNHAQIMDLDGEKLRIGHDYTRRKGEILMRQQEWFAENPSNTTLRKKMHGFFKQHPECWQLWKSYNAEVEGGEA